MTTDLVLAIAHHLLAFGLLAVMVMEFNMLRPGLSTSDLKRLGIVDAHYGALAMLLIVIGVCRVFFGIKGAAYYGDNPWFWAKMATFAGVGLLSALPTIRIVRWRRALKAVPGFTPTTREVARARKFVAAQLAIFPLLPIFAALMARNIGA
jgi:putative membrane protein